MASNLCFGFFLIKVSPAEFASGKTVEGIQYEPQDIFNGQFKGAQLR